MQITEVLHTCSNAYVAQAAVVSIGGEFASRLSRAANTHGVLPGVYAAIAVRNFEKSARPEERHSVARAMAGDDQPVLRGLRTILEGVLDAQDEDPLDDEDDRPTRRAAILAPWDARY